MKYLHKIKKEIKTVAIILFAFSAIAFVEKKQDNQVCRDISILIDYNDSNYFLNKEDIYQLITSNESVFLIGSTYNKIDLKQIETRVGINEYVSRVEAYNDLRGHITIDVTISNPVARLVIDGEKDLYICEDGTLIPTSEKHTSRVLLISGNYLKEVSKKNLEEDPTFDKLLNLVDYIHADDFWRAQIAQLVVDEEGSIVMYPQVTKQYIEFGKAEDIENKFTKLKTFYNTILPYKGWNYYNRVNIKYEDQIVCE